MADRKAFLLRIDPAVLEALQRWANDDLRSLNGQIEYVLRDALRKAGRAKGDAEGSGATPRPTSARPRREQTGDLPERPAEAEERGDGSPATGGDA
jgi:hypothetical protein